MLKRTRTTRFRCGHCGHRLVMHDRHLRRRVACQACGCATHPADGFSPVRRSAKPTPAALPRQPRAKTKPAETAAAAPTVPAPVAVPSCSPAPRASAPAAARLELSAAPLAPLVLIGLTAGAFFAAISLMSYLGGFISALVLVAMTAAALRWLKRGTVSIRARLEQIHAQRHRHGTFRVLAMLLTWLWSQPAARKPWGCLLILVWAGLYAPYCLRGILFDTPRASLIRVRV